jgi:hypothetical protein
LRQSHRQCQPGKACTCAYIRDSAGPSQLWNRKTTQCIRDVNLERHFRVSDGGMRVRLGRECLEEALDLARSGPPKAVARC